MYAPPRSSRRRRPSWPRSIRPRSLSKRMSLDGHVPRWATASADRTTARVCRLATTASADLHALTQTRARPRSCGRVLVCVPVIFHANWQRASRCCWYQRVVLCWFGSLTAGTMGIGELCPPLQLLSPPFAAATQLGGGVLVYSHGAVPGEAPRSRDAWRSPALWCCGSTRARPVG